VGAFFAWKGTPASPDRNESNSSVEGSGRRFDWFWIALDAQLMPAACSVTIKRLVSGFRLQPLNQPDFDD
jgi:hypothetical protein